MKHETDLVSKKLLRVKPIAPTKGQRLSKPQLKECRLKKTISLVLTKSYCSLANHNSECRCVNCTDLPFYTGVLRILHSCYTFCTPFSANQNFAVLRKCQGKMDYLVYEMLLIKKYRPSLNIQSDSIRAKVFTSLCVSLCQVTG